MTKLLFFGRARDAAGCSELICELPSSVETVAELRSWLHQRDPYLGSVLMARDIRVATDHTICVSDSASVRGAAEIAFMPPMSGG